MAEILDSLGYEKKLFPRYQLLLRQRESEREDLMRMLFAVDREVNKLSKLEVVARQNPNPHNIQKCVEQAELINSAIEHFEEHLTFALLLKK